MSGWRKHDFLEGQKYRLKAEIRTPTSHFLPGEIVVFTGSSHNRYDNHSAFTFLSYPTNEVKTWLLHDDDKGSE